MVAVWMVQAAVDQIVGVITMRHCCMTAPRAVAMRRIMAAATVFRAAAVGIGGTDFDDVILDMPVVRVLQMPLVEVIHVTIMANRNMTAAGTMCVRMIGVSSVGCHAVSPMIVAWGYDHQPTTDRLFRGPQYHVSSKPSGAAGQPLIDRVAETTEVAKTSTNSRRSPAP